MVLMRLVAAVTPTLATACVLLRVRLLLRRLLAFLRMRRLLACRFTLRFVRRLGLRRGVGALRLARLLLRV
jgi:hypothetical protein